MNNDALDLCYKYNVWGTMESTITGHFLLMPQKQGYFVMIYILDGIGTLSLNQCTYKLAAGHLILLRQDSVSSLNAEASPLSCLIFHLEGECSYLPTVVYLKEGSPLAKEIAIIKKQGDLLEPGTSLEPLDLFFGKLLVNISQTDQSDNHCPVQIRTLKRILDTRYNEELSLDGFANELYLNKYKLVKEFKKQYGISPIAYLLNRRIEKACFLLRSTNISITEVGSRVGLNNTTYFIHAFKKKSGCTPLSYRKKYQSNDFTLDCSLPNNV